MPSGGKSVSCVSKQTNRGIMITTPFMMTWGASVYTGGDSIEGNDKHTMQLMFPTPDNMTQETSIFLEKQRAFDNVIIDDIVANQDMWLGEENVSREVIKAKYFPSVKDPKIKGTKKIDTTKPPYLQLKVPFYADKQQWDVEVYDTNSKRLFPVCDIVTEDGTQVKTNASPVDFILRMSMVACVIQSKGIWISPAGWGVTWNVKQCIVKKSDLLSIVGKCQIEIPLEDRTPIHQDVSGTVITAAAVEKKLSIKDAAMVVDSDDEDTQTGAEIQPEVEIHTEDIPSAAIEESLPVAPLPAAKKIVKKIVVAAPTPPPTIPAVAPSAPVKKIVKRVVVAAEV